MHMLEQKRAAYAWQNVQKCSAMYCRLAKGAPALIMSNGLMQSLAFFESKGGEHHKALNSHILGWLCEQKLVSRRSFKEAMGELHDSTPPADFRRATEEALELLKWIRQFAAAVSKDV
ncbi:MAG: type III-B CRISPR module-associated protein Cmr5 [Gammaproteobacteria bacterium]|nr:type III-B CRISPR module-associated protein Cmr5 [Gammaproteobacteria bacterium]